MLIAGTVENTSQRRRTIVVVFFAYLVMAAVSHAQHERVNVSTSGAQTAIGSPSFPDPDSGDASVSDDGRFVSFTSYGSDLVPNDLNDDEDVFLRDRLSGTTVLVSGNPGGSGNSYSYGSHVSGNGEFVVFESYANDLVVGDTNGATDVFIYEVATQTVSRVSIAHDGSEGDGDSYADTVSADGRYVSFSSCATNLVPGDTNGVEDVFIRDRLLGTTTLVSLRPDGSPAQDYCWSARISANGEAVCWQTDDPMDPMDANGRPDIYVRDLLTGTTMLASPTPTGTTGDHDATDPAISGNGDFVVFESKASDLGPGSTNGEDDIYRFELATSTVILISNLGPNVVDGDCGDVSIDFSGNRIAYESDSVPGAISSGDDHIFVRDVAAGTTTMVTVLGCGVRGNDDHDEPSLSGDGRWVAYESSSTNFFASDANGVIDDIILTDTFAFRQAARIWVDAAAPGPGSGSLADPFADLADAAAMALFGDEVKVRPGTYTVDSISFCPGVAFESTGGADQTTISLATTAGGGASITADELVGFTITGTTDAACVALGAGGRVRDCVFENIVAPGAFSTILAAGSARIENCVFAGSSPSALIDLGTVDTGPVDVDIVCTTIHAVTGSHVLGAAAITPPGVVDLEVRGTIIRGGTLQMLGGMASGLSPLIQDCNLPVGTYPTGNAVNVIDADPLFVNAAAGDYRLLSGSTSIDTVCAGPAVPRFDADGKSRLLGAMVDMGAYEHGPDALLPGGVDDLVMTVRINGALQGEDSSSAATAGDNVLMEWRSPCGTLDGSGALLGVHFFAGAPPQTGFFDIHIGPDPMNIWVATMAPLTPSGSSLPYVVPVGFSGGSGRAQVLAVSSAARSGNLARSVAHEIVFN